MYVHPGGIIVLTSKGIISRYLYGTSFVPADVTMAVKEAAGGRIIPTISRAIAFCYSYDPASRGYVLNVTRLVGAATLVLVGVFAIFVLRTKSKRKRQRS